MATATPVLVRDETAWQGGRIAIAGGLILGFGLWLLQLILTYGLSSYACFPVSKPSPRVVPGFGWVWYADISINLAALLMAFVAAGFALQRWRLTSSTGPPSFDDVVEKGERGPQYLELWGLATGLGFAAVIIFNTIALFVVPICAN